MARITSAPNQGEVVAIVPDIDDNKESPRPLEVHVLMPTEGERRRLSRQISKKFPEDKDVDVDEWAEFQEGVLMDRVKSVVNYKHGGKDIKTAEDLVEYGESVVCGIVFGEIISGGRLTEEEEKNSD